MNDDGSTAWYDSDEIEALAGDGWSDDPLSLEGGMERVS